MHEVQSNCSGPAVILTITEVGKSVQFQITSIDEPYVRPQCFEINPQNGFVLLCENPEKVLFH